MNTHPPHIVHPGMKAMVSGLRYRQIQSPVDDTFVCAANYPSVSRILKTGGVLSETEQQFVLFLSFKNQQRNHKKGTSDY
jgi:hypothetical protein